DAGPIVHDYRIEPLIGCGDRIEAQGAVSCAVDGGAIFTPFITERLTAESSDCKGSAATHCGNCILRLNRDGRRHPGWHLDHADIIDQGRAIATVGSALDETQLKRLGFGCEDVARDFDVWIAAADRAPPMDWYDRCVADLDLNRRNRSDGRRVFEIAH